jgi:hypothetical protein
MRFTRRDGVTFERSGDRATVLDGDGLVLSSLSPVGTLIWELLPNDLGPIVDDLATRFPAVAHEQLTADAERFLGELVASGLVADADADPLD